MMSKYKVIWEIDIDEDEAASPIEAAKVARSIQQDMENIATVFSVIDMESQEVYNVDLHYIQPVYDGELYDF